MLIRLAIPYDSDEGVGMAGRIMRVISQEADQTSQDLAHERDVFPNWKGSLYDIRGIRMRNATRLAIAPTGTIGIIAGTSAGIEPLFALAYKRSQVLNGQVLYEMNPIFLEYLDRYGLEARRIAEEVQEKGRLRDVEGVPKELKRLFITALEIPPERHLQIQAAFQQYVDNSVSKTINLPHEATAQDIAKIYFGA